MEKRLLTLDDCKKIELDMLLSFASFCEQNGLRYDLAGGTLLGAIRHKGFIPWDDDIDISMPRPDYEKLVKIYPTDGMEDLDLLENRRTGFVYPFARLVNRRTLVTAKYMDEHDLSHLWVDILPVDGLPEDNKELAHIYRWVYFYRVLLSACYAKQWFYGRSLMKKILRPFTILAAKVIGPQWLFHKVDSIAQTYRYEECSYVGVVSWGLYGVGERMLKSEYAHQVLVDFEGHKLPTYSCWESYLSGLYGNYMALPPEAQRKTHDIQAYLLEDKSSC